MGVPELMERTGNDEILGEAIKPEDRIDVKCEGDTATLVVFSQSGIGRATLTSTNGNWPTTVILQLHLAGLEHFAISTGKLKLTGSVLSQSGNKARLCLTEDGSEEDEFNQRPCCVW